MLPSHDAFSLPAAAAIRSLNAEFVRKGIVVSEAEVGARVLDPTVRCLVDALKNSCKVAGTRDLSDITSAIQLWKERSLHHTLQTLDQVKKDCPPMDGNSRHIQAIELHEKAGREIKEAVLRVLQNVVDTVTKRIDDFTVELAITIHKLVQPELAEQLVREKAMTERLITEKQQWIRDTFALHDAHAALTKRIDEWEHAEDGGGDALLCRKLREQVKQLQAQQAERETAMHEMARQNEQWRYEMVAMKAELETAYKTLAMTRAMQDKEAKQLAEILYTRCDQFERVRHATSVAVGAAATRVEATGVPPTVTAYDAHSGRSICYQSPTKAPRSVLASLPPPSRPQSQRRKSAEPASAPRSPNQKRAVASARPMVTASRQERDETVNVLEQQPSPHGRMARPFPSPRLPNRFF